MQTSWKTPLVVSFSDYVRYVSATIMFIVFIVREPTSSELTGNDFADRAYCVLEKKLPRFGTGFTIAQINTFLDGISERNVTMQQKVERFRVLFRQITGLEMKWMTRILLKDLRLGIGMQRILHSSYNLPYSTY